MTAVLDELVRCRKLRGVTQFDLAARAGVSRRMVSAYEAGSSQPSIGAVVKLAAALGYELQLVPLPPSPKVSVSELPPPQFVAPPPPPVSPQRAAELAAIERFQREHEVKVLPAPQTPEFAAFNEANPLVWDKHRRVATRNPVKTKSNWASF